jgi:Zn-dependent peptidase ImmA (M78 family)/transcriptional regulator with XRE-family HTH domain
LLTPRTELEDRSSVRPIGHWDQGKSDAKRKILTFYVRYARLIPGAPALSAAQTKGDTMIDAAQLGLRLRAARERLGLSQQAVAEVLALPRTAVTNIETGMRAVSTLELTKLAALYRQSPAHFFDEHANNAEDLSVVLPRALQSAADGPEFNEAIERIADLCREGTALRHVLDQDFELGLPDYSAKIATAGEAIRHAETVALEERRRIGLGNAPAIEIAELIGSQGIWVASSKLPENMSGLFLNHASVGFAIVINRDHSPVRRRFSYAHEYGHALFDRVETVRLTRQQNAGELVEKRANAFAAAFLMPASGVSEQLRRLDKGQASRQLQIVYDVANDAATEAEIRPPTGSQAITFQDVRAIARHFGVSYESTVWRLKSLGHISSAETETLMALKGKSPKLAEILKMRAEDFPASPDDLEQELWGQLARLAIEAYRRGEISQGRLRELAKKLDIAPADLLDLAEAARSD